jgi:predicted regulator of Ras-like GTPase activity (Roadblock/LC7/MglB family)
MSMQGSLRDMSVADLIQHNCQDRRNALVTLEHEGRTAQIYFKEGAVVHAVLDDVSGEEVIYQTLGWDEGRFILEIGINAPQQTIKRSWSSLLLEGAKRLDEISISETSESDTKAGSSEQSQDQVKILLTYFVDTSKTFRGVAIAGIDGFIRQGHFNDIFEESLVGAIAAACLNFGRRSLNLANQGNFQEAYLRGESGDIVVVMINKYSLLVGLTAAEPDLKAISSEIHSLAGQLAQII